MLMSKNVNNDVSKDSPIQYNTIQYSLFNEGEVINPRSYLTYGLQNGTNTDIKQCLISNIRFTSRESKTRQMYG